MATKLYRAGINRPGETAGWDSAECSNIDKAIRWFSQADYEHVYYALKLMHHTGHPLDDGMSLALGNELFYIEWT